MRACLAVLFLVACGPSSAQIKEARDAHYTMAAMDVFAQARDATEAAGYAIRQSDDTHGAFETEARWYDPDGNYAPKSASGGFEVVDRSVLLALVVRVVGKDGDWHIEIAPDAAENVEGSPQGRPLLPGDPSMPGWVSGKIDNLYVAIHARLAKPQGS